MSKTQEEIWIEDACSLIRESPALRFFFQNFFDNTGIYSAPPREPELISRAAGQRDVALDVKAMLDRNDPTLYHELQLAYVKYLIEVKDG